VGGRETGEEVGTYTKIGRERGMIWHDVYLKYFKGRKKELRVFFFSAKRRNKTLLSCVEGRRRMKEIKRLMEMKENRERNGNRRIREFKT
jgi:hypothetical protein